MAQLEATRRARGLNLQQLVYHIAPASRTMHTLHELHATLTGAAPASASAPAAAGPRGGGGIHTYRGGALLRLLHARRLVHSGDTEACALYDYLLERAAAPYWRILRGWIYRGQCDDPYAEFAVRESPQARPASPYYHMMIRPPIHRVMGAS